MAQRKYSKAKLEGSLGVSLSDKQYSDLQKIKERSPSKTTYKNIAKNYFTPDKFDIEETKDRPVNNILDNIDEYVRRNPKVKIYIKQKGAGDYMSVSAKAASIAVGKLNSEVWRKGNEMMEEEEEQTGVSGTNIPEMEVVEMLNVKTKVASKVFLDFNTVNYSNTAKTK